MASTSISPSLHFRNNPPLCRRPSCSFFLLRFPSISSSPAPRRFLALRASTAAQAYLRRPVVTPSLTDEEEEEEDLNEESSGTLSDDEDDDSDAEEGAVDGRRASRGSRKERRRVEWVDWEDQILEDTVPLVGFVRMILHSGKYESGDQLSPEHEKAILERLLAYHPEAEKKIGCGIDYITIGFHPDYESSRCLFIVRKDGELVDFSYWKCIKGLIREKYPLYADSFILRHFWRRKYD